MILVVLLTVQSCVYAQTTQMDYRMGGSLTNTVITKFTFSRNVNTTTVTWQQFGAEADGDGIVTTQPTDAYPSGFEFSNLYRGFPPMGITRWSYTLQQKVATLQISNTVPVITVLPTDASAFGPGQIVTIRSGSITFLNTDVNLNGQPGTIGGLLSTLGTATLASTTGATTVGSPPSARAMAMEISLPLTFLFITVVVLSI